MSAATLERLFNANDSGVDRQMLAGLLLELARNLDANVGVEPTGIKPFDPRLEQLRSLLLRREIELSQRFSQLLDNPEQFAIAVSRVLPSAIAQASVHDERLGQVLAPALGSSVRRDPATLVNVLYPLMVPAIGKSIAETIDAMFQSFNESLKHSISWRGLKWRWEAWRTGTSFAEVVLKHTLVYQVEHVFLIHRNSGLLIAHAASPDAVSQDPQLVASMLAAIQEFVRDSFSGAEQQGLDALRFGELRLWSEPGPFATLVAVIRGTPPESLHETFRKVLSRIHTERHEALQAFNGDGAAFADIEASLTECVQHRQEALRSREGRFIWPYVVVGLVSVTAVGTWGYQRWSNERLWEKYLARLHAQPGIVITEMGTRDGKWFVRGLRDPLAVDPQLTLRESSIDPAHVISHWEPYQSLNSELTLKRVMEALLPPPTVAIAMDGDQIVATGSASSAWIQHARAYSRTLPVGAPQFDFSQVQDLDEADERLWNSYLARLRAEPGIVVTEIGKGEGKWRVAGLRDPLAADPQLVLRESSIDPERVISHWEPYQSLKAEFVLKRLQDALTPPPTVSLAVENEKIVARGSTSQAWLQRAGAVSRTLPAGAPPLDLSQVRDLNEGVLGKLREAIEAKEIRFEYKNPRPARDQEPILDRLAEELRELTALSSTLRVTTSVTLTGHSDSTGQETFNLSLSLARAEAVRALLKKRGVDPALLAVRAAGVLEPLQTEDSETARSVNRRVSFTVGIHE